jgi:DNA-binding PadR family transcriptional regulator
MRSRVDAPATCDPDGHFSDTQLLVLASLAGGPKHGHAMLDDIQQMCGTRLGPGTLYGAIARLERRGWIEPLPVHDRRKPYRLTKLGQQAYAAKMKTLQRIVGYEAGRLAPT